MSIIVKTNDPKGLLAAIKDGIDENEIRTWSYDKDGDFTHANTSWEGKAWLAALPLVDEIIFGIIPPKKGTITKRVYGVYHGRFIEMLLAHFDDKFTSIETTALATIYDTCEDEEAA